MSAEIQSALADKSEIQAELDALEQRVTNLSLQLDESTERRRALVETELSAAGQRLLDGEEAAPANPQRVIEIRDLGKQIEAIVPAIAICEQRQSEVREKLARTNEILADAIYRRIREIHAASAKSLRSSIEKMAPHLALMVAADRARNNTASATGGMAKPLSEDVDGDFSGEFVTTKLLEGITHFIRPALFDDAGFSLLIEKRNKELLAEFEGGSE